MRRTEDVSFDYKVNTKSETTKKVEKKSKKTFKIDIKNSAQESRKEKPAQVKVRKGLWEIIYEWMDSFVFSIILPAISWCPVALGLN